ncbi:MAG: ABC transporter ATP-binding protein [Candidatus Marinimicrobia bacterium]|nr:ABC transporter ATP-binding protein [Candidatus Neomarinimicrobiota bacterium]
MSCLPLLQVTNLRVVFDLQHGSQKRIIDDVDFVLNKGEILGIVGESGSGKTQTVLALLGIHIQNPGVVKGEIKFQISDSRLEDLSSSHIDKYVSYSKGKITEMYYKNEKRWKKSIDQQYGLHEIRGNRIFIMFQDPKSYLNPFWTIRKHFKKIVPTRSLDGLSHEEVMIEALKKFNLPIDQVPASYPHQLSGGMNQRVMIALGYACKPDVIIADEITTGLDIVNQVVVVKHLKHIQQECNLSIILISHDLGFISKLSDKILVLYNGQGMEFGPADIILDPKQTRKHPYTRELMEIFNESHKQGYISGEPPRRDEIINGCRFHKRCREYFNNPVLNCSKNAPTDFTDLIQAPHQVRCALFQD